MYLNLIKNGKFDEGVIHKMQKINSYVGKMKIHIKRSFVLNSLVGYLYENNLLPAICFIFSRNQVEQAAREISGHRRGHQHYRCRANGQIYR